MKKISNYKSKSSTKLKFNMDHKESTVEKFNKIDDLTETNGFNVQLNGYSNDNLNNKSIDKNVQTIQLNKQTELKNTKRKNYLIWEDYFMSIALLSAQRSKDPSTQVGACIVNSDNKIVSIGYNGMPVNCNDDLLPWGKNSDNELDNKYLYVCHAELNSVLNSSASNLKDCSIYVTLFPCNECAKVIIQSGIKKIYYLDKKKEDKPEYIASKRLLDMANIKLIHYKPKEKEIVLKLQVSN